MKNCNVIILTIFIILGMISIPTIYKIFNKHSEDALQVVKEEFIFASKKCYWHDDCEKIVYLKDLYEKEYLEERLTNPKNKKYYSEESYVNLETMEVNLVS